MNKLPRILLVWLIGLIATLGWISSPGNLAMAGEPSAISPGQIRVEIDEQGRLHLTPDRITQELAFSLQRAETGGQVSIASRSGRDDSLRQPVRADQDRFWLHTTQGQLEILLPEQGERLDLELASAQQGKRVILESGQDLAVVGANLAGSLTLQAQNRLALGPGTFQVAGDLSLLAGESLRIRDEKTRPLRTYVGGQFILQGQQAVDIFALSHPHSALVAKGDIVLRSAQPARGDAHFLAGSQFRIEQLDGRPGDLVSPYDPIILASENVSLGGYTGASLHILAGGTVTLGNVTITGNDTAANTINPANPALFNGVDPIGSLASFNLSDGTPVTIDGSIQPTLDVRAGVAWNTFSGGAPGNQVIPPAVIVPTFSGPVTSAAITVGNITLAPPNGLVLLTNQYHPNVASGDITTGNINTSTASPGGSGGAILIDARDHVVAGFINTAANVAGSAANNGGDVRVIAEGNINQGAVSTFAQSDSTTAGNGGNVTITASGVLTATSISTYAQSVTGSGNAGDIQVSASGTLTMTTIRSHARFSGTGYSGDAGDVSILVRNTGPLDGADDLHLSYIWSDTGAWYSGGAVGPSGNGANLSLVTEDGDIVFDNWAWVQTLARGETNNAGNGGDIAITAANGGITIGSFGINTRTEVASGSGGNTGLSGDVSLIADGDINVNVAGTNGGILADSRVISGTAQGSGVVLIQSTNGSIDFGANGITVQSFSNGGQAGDTGGITLEATGSINAGGIHSHSEAGSGSAGNAGPVALSAGNDIEVVSINATALGGASHGAGGGISVETSQFFRATGLTPTGASIANQGLANSSTITITHGGGGITPFIVGDAATNGTAGAITTGDATLNPTQPYFYSHFEAPNLWIVSVPSPLAIDKQAAPSSEVAYHGPITYTIMLSNSSGTPADTVVLTDTLPAEVSFDHWIQQPAGAGVVAGELTWTGTAPANGQVTFSFVVNHAGDYGQVVTNTARFFHPASGSQGSAEATFMVEPDPGIPPPENELIYIPIVLK